MAAVGATEKAATRASNINLHVSTDPKNCAEQKMAAVGSMEKVDESTSNAGSAWKPTLVSIEDTPNSNDKNECPRCHGSGTVAFLARNSARPGELLDIEMDAQCNLCGGTGKTT